MRRAAVFIATCTLLAACGSKETAVVVHPADAIPARLSEWGVVLTNGNQFQFNDGVVPYDLNTPLFSDYALKIRSVWMPAGTRARYSADREFDFPIGTIISKTFHYQKAAQWRDAEFKVIKADREAALDDSGQLDLDDYVLLETRLLVRYADGWQALPYVWNAAQDEAFLELAGETRNVRLTDAQGVEDIVYVVPDANQCGGCHTPDHSAGELRPLGPRAWQLNRHYAYRDTTANQLEHWSALGILDELEAAPPTGARWSRSDGASLEQRAKAYLDANCAHCHNPAGAADTSALHLNIDAPVDRLYGVCKPPVAVGRGSGDRPYDIYPGRPEDSIMVYRMQHSDPAIAMPELGRSAVHSEGVALVSEWIAGMNGEC